MSRRVLLTVLFFVTSFTLSFGQSSITGKVVDGTNGEVLENAKVYLLNTEKRPYQTPMEPLNLKA